MISIYKLVDPETNEIRYIGQTSNIKKRYINHLQGNKYRNTHTTNWIQSLLNKNLKPIIEIIDICNIENLDIIEQKYIKEYKEKGNNLTNHSIGGHSSLGCKHSEESKLKRSIRQKGKKLNISKEGKENTIKAALKMLEERPYLRIDNLLSKEERYKAALKGNKIASEKACKKVYKLNPKTLEIIKEYKSLKECGLDNKIPRSSVSGILNNRVKQKNEFILSRFSNINTN